MKQEQEQRRLLVFFSYAQADQMWHEQLAKHLSQLARDGLIERWSHQQILPGVDRAREIDQALHSAHIILLLISADFLASDAQYQIEMQHALERHRRGEVRVVPIIVRPCDWQSSPFAHLQCLPRRGSPISTWDNPDEAFLAVAQELRQIIAHQQVPSPPLSQVQRQNRARLLKRVRTTWIEGLLEHSLHRTAWIDLHLQDQPDMLENPWRLQVQELNQEPHVLPTGTSIVQVYDEAEGKLLILGEPGAGKTTLLLHLAQALLDRAEADERVPTPVVFNLSSWTHQRQPLAAWLIDELQTKYQVPRHMAELWVERRQVLPLLDGLDEVAEEARVACLQAITDYSSRHSSQIGTPLVVCCRSQEYQELSLDVLLSRAVSILPLTGQQIDVYLSHAQGRLERLRQALHENAELATLAHRPLMLSIFTLAYQGADAQDFLTSSSSQEQTMHAVFSIYVKRMLSRRKALPPWMQKHFLHWLISLASQLHQHNQSVFQVKDLLPDWLPKKQRGRFRWIVGLLCGLQGLYSGTLVGLFFGPLVGLIVGLTLGLLFGSLGAIMSLKDPITPVESTWRSLWQCLRRGLLFAPLVGLISALIVGLPSGLLTGLSLGLLLVPSSVRVKLLTGLTFGLSLGLLFELHSGLTLIGLFFRLLAGLFPELLIRLLIGLAAGLGFGLGAFLLGTVLQFLLWRANCLPWRLVPFLDEAAERLFLRKVGGSYIFVHRLLLEFLASLEKQES